MYLELTINGELVSLEFKVKQKTDISDHEREWVLASNGESEGSYEVKFREEAYVLQEILAQPEELATTKEVLTEIINESLKEEYEKRQEGIDDSEEGDDSEEVQPYDPKKISIRSDRWSISQTFDLINKWKEVDLSPDFQRNFVWDRKRRSRLIESLMLGIPVPAFYLSETKDGKYQVVDGVQRLSTITNFLNNVFPLRGLEYLKEQEGRYYEAKGKRTGIDHEFLKRILLTQINVNIIDAKSPAKVKFDVFRRVNTGGKPLNSQEIRNCLADKGVRELINELAESEEFKVATDGSVKTTRMQAQELVLRFIFFYHTEIVNHKDWVYRGNMREALDEALELLNNNQSISFEEIKAAFYKSMKNCAHLFGEFCFRKCLPKDLEPKARRPLINKSLFTTWSTEMTKHDLEKLERQFEYKAFSRILANYLSENRSALDTVSYNTNDKTFLETAFKNTRTLIKEKLTA